LVQPALGGKTQTREAELILSCVASDAPGAERTKRLRMIVGTGVDWQVVMRSACKHGVLPAVHRALIPEFASRIPRTVRDWMHREVRGNALRNHYLAAEMVRVCHLLEKHGVRALALKGPALAAGVYQDLALRQFTDLDLLVRYDDLRVAVNVLADDGFRTKAPLNQLWGWEATFVREPGLFELDLHWRLSPSYFAVTPEGDELWARAVEVNLGPGCVWTLGPDDLMLFLCAHGAKHGWQSLSGVRDVAAAARVHRYDWEAVTERAKSLGSLRIILLGLLLCRDLLNAPIPESLITAANAEPSVLQAVSRFRQYFVQLGTGGPSLSQRWSIPLAMIPHRWTRLRYALARALLPGPKDFDYLTLPSTWSPLYYLVRPLRFASKAIASSGYRGYRSVQRSVSRVLE
jgi:Uncharacterised nucleotidyltransferase